MFRTLAYSEPETYSEPRAYSEPCPTSTMERFAKIVKGYNYFRNINFSRSLLYEINTMNSFNTGLIFTPEVFILCKQVRESRGPGAVNFDILSVLQLFVKVRKL